MSAMGATKSFHCLTNTLTTQAATISYKKMKHPQDSYAYCVDDGKHRFIYSTDTELADEDFVRNEENESFFRDADLIVLDSQYTLKEAFDKYGWGHSSFSMATDFAAHWGIKRVDLYHHDPTYDDQKLLENLQAARSYAEYMHFKDTHLILATEGLEITL
jgi:phosphoribosyl 1,2-cyclic phosphodiesterase